MKKYLGLTVISSILCSQMGCIGNPCSDTQPAKNTFAPYVTPENKPKLAKVLFQVEGSLSEDFFETVDYSLVNRENISNLLQVLETPEERQFWKSLIILRQAMCALVVFAEGVEDYLQSQLDEVSAEVIAAVVSYEQQHPYTPDFAQLQDARHFMMGMALGNMPIPPSLKEQEKMIEEWGGLDAKKAYQQSREKLLQLYQRVAALKQAKPAEDKFIQPKNQQEALKLAMRVANMINAADPNHKSPLSVAVYNKDTKWVLEQIEDGVDVNQRDGDGKTPLMVAVETGNTEIVKLLLEAGADPKIRLNDTDKTALSMAESAGLNEIVALLKPVEVSPLEQALGARDTAKVLELIKAGTDVNARGASGYTPLIIAVLFTDAELVKALIQAGADVNAKAIVDGQEMDITALSMAQSMGFEEGIKLLKEAGAK